MANYKYWIENSNVAGYFETDNRGFIRKTSPVFRVFVGQMAYRLELWMKRMSRTTIKQIENKQREFAFMEAS